MSWEDVLQHHTVPAAEAAPERAGTEREPDADTARLLAAGRAEDKQYLEEQQARWERTDPGREAEPADLEAGA